MEDFKKKVSITDPMDSEPKPAAAPASAAASSTAAAAAAPQVLDLLRRFLAVQQRRAEAYAKLTRYAKLKSGFAEYMVSGGEVACH